jgi:hypothetical protein
VTTTEECSDGISDDGLALVPNGASELERAEEAAAMALYVATWGELMNDEDWAAWRQARPRLLRSAARALGAANYAGLLSDRDRARSVAVALEQQVAALSSALNVALGHAEGTVAATWAERTAELAGCRIVLNDCASPAGDEDGDRG